MSKDEIMESLLGERVVVEVNNRIEDEYSGELISVSSQWLTLKYQSHSREFLHAFPLQSIVGVSYKVLDAK